jgi:predicted transcriptional regulator
LAARVSDAASRGLSGMLVPHINDLGLRMMEVLWTRGPCSIRAIYDALPEDERPRINTARATFHRLLHNGYARRVGQVSHSAVFEAVVTRESVYDAAIDSFAELFQEDMGSVLARLVTTGRLNAQDLEVVGRVLRNTARTVPSPKRLRSVS